jgi:hypothetical protein
MHDSNSYLNIQELAESETKAILENYFTMAILSKAKNNMAPTPYNWPGLFEHFLEIFEIANLWNTVSESHGFTARYSTSVVANDFKLSRYQTYPASPSIQKSTFISLIKSQLRKFFELFLKV